MKTTLTATVFPCKRSRNITIILCLLGLLGSTTIVSAQINIALGKPVTASSIVAATPAANLTDGNITTVAGTANTLVSPNTEWLQIDLGAETVIENIRIRTNPSNHNRGRRFMILTWRTSLGPTALGSDPHTYIGTGSTVSRFNRIIYTVASSVTTTDVFGGTVPGAAGAAMGPDYTVRTFNVGVHPARYIRIIALNDEPLELAELEVFASSVVPQRDFTNGGFEQGYAGAANTNSNIHEAAVDGWSTSEAVAMFGSGGFADPTNGGFMEYWANNFLSVPANQGTYFVELNAFTNGSLSQEPICVLPGEVFTWSFAHRGRAGVDVMRMVINGTDVAEFTDGNTAGSTHTGVVLDAATTAIATHVAEGSGWTQYTGTWTNTTGTALTVIFSFRAVSTSTGDVSVGNLLDDVSLVPLSALVTFSTAASFGPESTPTANMPWLLVNGTVGAGGATVEVNITGGTATRGVDYTTTPAAGAISITIPAGVYDGTAATAISLGTHIQINTDGLAEAAETILLALQNPVGVAIPAATGCVTGTITNTYTIADASDISGNVFNDANGLSNSLIDGTPYTGPQLHVNIVDVNGLVVASVPVNTTTGAYTATGVVAGNYTIELSVNTGTIGAQAPLVNASGGWTFTGEGTGAGDGTPDGKFAITVAGVNATVNFGVDRLPVAATASTTIPNPTQGARITLNGAGSNPPIPVATDAEDGSLGANNTIVISQLPTNSTLYYNNVAVTAGQVIPNFNPTLLQVEINGLTFGSISTSFSFSYRDAAGIAAVPVVYTLNWAFSLPVKLTSFIARLQHPDVLVTWQTAQEQNNDHFGIEYSTDGVLFKKAGEVKGSGTTNSTTNYQFLHPGAGLSDAGVLYYRMEQVDIDGRSTISKTAKVFLQGTGASHIYPNPVQRGSQLTITATKVREIALFNIHGKRIWQNTWQGNPSMVNIPTRQLPAGTYVVYVNKERQPVKIVVVE